MKTKENKVIYLEQKGSGVYYHHIIKFIDGVRVTTYALDINAGPMSHMWCECHFKTIGIDEYPNAKVLTEEELFLLLL